MDDRDRELEELRAENRRLREQLGKEKKKPVIPTEILEKHKELKGILYTDWMPWMEKKKQTDYDIDTGMQGNISQLVRSVLFNETKMKGKSKETYLLCMEMSDEEYALYTGTVDQILRALEFGRRAKASGFSVEQEAGADAMRISECVYDMAIQAATMMDDMPENRKDTFDSRDLYHSIHHWAREFEDEFDKDGEEEDYLEKIDEFGNRKLREYFDMEA